MNERTVRRFWAKVRKTKTCWLWTASKRDTGYGAFVWCGQDGEVVQGRAHRFSWELHNGPIPAGVCVLHRCDNPACVRPDHLFLGTKADNNADMRRKGRSVKGGTYQRAGYERGENHHAAKLNAEAVRAIRADRAAGLSYGQVHKKYGIAIGHLYRIVNRKAWKHIE